jgi:hypothetical protein
MSCLIIKYIPNGINQTKKNKNSLWAILFFSLVLTLKLN